MKVCHIEARGCNLDRHASRGRVLQEATPVAKGKEDTRCGSYGVY